MSNKNLDFEKIFKNIDKDKKIISYIEDAVNAIGSLFDKIDDAIRKK